MHQLVLFRSFFYNYKCCTRQQSGGGTYYDLPAYIYLLAHF